MLRFDAETEDVFTWGLSDKGATPVQSQMAEESFGFVFGLGVVGAGAVQELAHDEHADDHGDGHSDDDDELGGH